MMICEIVKYLILNQDFKNYFSTLRVMIMYQNRSKTEQRHCGEGTQFSFIYSLELYAQIEEIPFTRPNV